jgi:hypothetical protein
MDNVMVIRMVSGVLAVIVLAVIVMRRRQKAIE